MIIIVNGKEEQIDKDAALFSIINKFSLDIDRIVLEHNGDIPDKTAYNEIILKENDRIEIIQFVGGG